MPEINTENMEPAGEVAADCEGMGVEPDSPVPAPLTVEELLSAWDADRKEMEGEILRRDQAIAAYHERLLRLQADFDNFRKRKQKEDQELVGNITERVLRKFLPVLDNLERALDSCQGEGEATAILAGVEMVLRQLRSVLQEEGVSAMEAAGRPFNPELYHAVARIESEDYEEDTVVDELQKGYYYQGRVLRPALVRVARRPGPKVVPLKKNGEEGVSEDE
ncbi:MAG: nucleotide exchange factor GrpE [Clostridia bacterium]|nr:MAG: nucleotide exchange factor GrpE [Clostridia bacterium]